MRNVTRLTALRTWLCHDRLNQLQVEGNIPAAVMIDWNTTERGDVPDPAISKGEVLVYKKNIGICGTEAYLFTGMREIEYPHISMRELGGNVVKTTTE
jgi:threonine dehydrogenase-like Zn-dependent dehydrogenase